MCINDVWVALALSKCFALHQCHRQLVAIHGHSQRAKHLLSVVGGFGCNRSTCFAPTALPYDALRAASQSHCVHGFRRDVPSIPVQNVFD